MSKNRLCMFFNTPSLYRKSVYKKIDENFDCDWYFGDYTGGVKSFDINLLKQSSYLHVSNARHRVYWTVGLLKLLFDKRYDVYFMYASTWDLCMWLFLLLRSLFFRRKKINFWCHGWYGKENCLEALLKKIMYNSADRVFCYGEYARRLLLDMGYAPDKICAIHNSLDYEYQLEIRSTLSPSDIYIKHFKTMAPVLLFIGRLTKVKRLDLLLDAMALLKQQGHCYNLMIVGDGEEKEYLQNLIERHGLESFVWLYGACYDDKVNAELIYNADLCVAPGNVGLTAIHSMTFGTPVATHHEFKFQMPEFESIKEGETGSFFEYNDRESIAETILKWFDIHRGDRDEVRKACYAEIENNWTPDFQLKVIKDNLFI